MYRLEIKCTGWFPSGIHHGRVDPHLKQQETIAWNALFVDDTASPLWIYLFKEYLAISCHCSTRGVYCSLSKLLQQFNCKSQNLPSSRRAMMMALYLWVFVSSVTMVTMMVMIRNDDITLGSLEMCSTHPRLVSDGNNRNYITNPYSFQHIRWNSSMVWSRR